MYIPTGAFEEFLAGSIIKTDDQIPLNTLTTYFIFKVVIGRAYVRRRSKMDPLNRGDRMQPPDDYDSVYVHEDDDTLADMSLSDVMDQEKEVHRSKITHTYAIFSNEKIRLLYEVRFKIVIPKAPKVIYCDICLRQAQTQNVVSDTQSHAHSVGRPSI